MFTVCAVKWELGLIYLLLQEEELMQSARRAYPDMHTLPTTRTIIRDAMQYDHDCMRFYAL